MEHGNRYVLIPAGGTGTRMGADIPKQFLPLAGKPIIIHTLNAFINAIPGIEIVLALPKEHADYWEKIKNEYLPNTEVKTTIGGATRFESVSKGLKLLPNKGVVAIHDAVRPFATQQLIERCFVWAEKNGTAIAAIEPKDSLFQIKADRVFARNRTKFRMAQTPQCFDLREIKKAFNQPYTPAFTDDASVYEAFGGTIHLVDGEYSNFKITTPEDLVIAEALLKGR